MRKSKGKNGKLLPNSLGIISSCIKTVSTSASTIVRSAGASVAASISSPGDGRKEQVLWVGFDMLELSQTSFRRVLLLGYLSGFQVFDVEDANGLSELISRHDGPVTFLQMLPAPANFDGDENYKNLHPILVVVGGNKDEKITPHHNTGQGPSRYSSDDSSFGSSFDPPTSVRFYSMKSNEYVKVFDFKSAVLMVRCSPRVVAIGLEEQVYCFDTLTLDKKFVVITYPVPRFNEQGSIGIDTGCGPMAVGPRWLAYPPNRPFVSNTARLSPKRLNSSVSPSTSPGSGSLMARYAVESSKHLAAGIYTLGDMGYKKLSKYCPDLLPDGPSSPGRKNGKLAAYEPENAGVVVVRDLVSSEVISQFRAHTSPISALCFDPSGTLLVTASVYGNNINIFRIMPSHTSNGSGCSDWSTSCVHLYKLYRGITTAVIQDICFSQYSQWIAIVSSKGTCHIFVLSPFGGDDGFQALHTHEQGTTLFLASSSPWWSTPSFTINEQKSTPPPPPPPPCTLSVVTRIKCSDSGLLNSVSNAAASMVGKTWVPSGALAAIFHNLNTTGSIDGHSSNSLLEHILVYTPSGFVVQHEIQSSMGFEPSDSRIESQSNPQNEEFRVKVEPAQWWDVCRRLDNLEREECLSRSFFDGKTSPDIDGVKKLVTNDSLKSPDRSSHWYLSNAEVQINSCRLPIWQKSKIRFHVMEPPKEEYYSGGEFEIEMAPSHEVEKRHKGLLPIFDHFPTTRSGWIERTMPSEGKYAGNSQAIEKTDEESVICHSKPPSFSSTESSEGGSSRRMETLLDLDHMTIDRSPKLVTHSANDSKVEKEKDSRSKPIMPFTSDQKPGANFLVDSTSGSFSPVNEISLETDNTESAPDMAEKKLDFGLFFKDGYCNKPELHDDLNTTEVVTDEMDNRGNAREEEKSEEGWIGGMFDFSEEGL